jgi:nucleoside-diphosphate-sugar epimerase
MTMQDLPETIQTAEQLDELLSRPSRKLVEFVAALDGDLMILGAGGKIGPSMARMAQRAVQQAGADKRVYAVDVAPLPALAEAGLATLACDMLDLAAIQRLPRARNIVFMAGRKFGSTGGEHLTWAVNVVVPYHVARTFTDSRIVAFSTGCVYPLADVHGGGSTELTGPDPVGEYAMSCLGRERMFDFFSRTQGEHVLQFRLNYAVELRYGVLVDVAGKVFRGEELDITTGYANVLWQGDVCNQALLCLGQAASPPAVLNVTGPETISIREVAHEFGRLFGKAPRIVGTENGRGYLSNAARAKELFGPPSVGLDRLIPWIARWIEAGGENLGKPTHFEAQDGKY